jgi:beta-glucosidase
MQKKPGLEFPNKFLWGASTSAHQVEGGTHNQWTVWELENAKSLAAQAEYHYGDLENWDAIKKEAKDPGNYVSEDAADHYLLYKDDFTLLQKMNMNAYRFSVEWSRIEPEEGVWNKEAIDHYKTYIKELENRDIEPIVTLFHFTLPVWFVEKGGFEKRSNVSYFVRFAEKIVRELGPSVRFIVTINEPDIYAREGYMTGNWPPAQTSKFMFLRVLHNLMYAHRKASSAIHAINRRYKVSLAKNVTYVYPGDDAWLSRKSAQIMQYLYDDYLLKRVIRSCDFIGVNYYASNRVYGYRIHSPEDELSDLGWSMTPAEIQYTLERLHNKYRLPIIITENGLADADDNKRQWWITQTLIGVQKAMDNGVNVQGYLHWSLLDNFEWDKGVWPRFGLVAVDYRTMKRTLRPSSIWFGKIIKHLRKIN